MPTLATWSRWSPPGSPAVRTSKSFFLINTYFCGKGILESPNIPILGRISESCFESRFLLYLSLFYCHSCLFWCLKYLKFGHRGYFYSEVCVVLTGLHYSLSSVLLSGYKMFQVYLYLLCLGSVAFIVEWSLENKISCPHVLIAAKCSSPDLQRNYDCF